VSSLVAGSLSADEVPEALVLLAACGAALEVSTKAGDRGVDVGAGQFQLDIPVELLEAGVAADLRLGGAEKALERVVRDGTLRHIASSWGA
jgi:hypothetical protein